MKKFCVLFSSLFAMSQCSSSNIETYVFGTDAGYIYPTIQAINSLNKNTLAQKQIIVLETDDAYRTDAERAAFKELSRSNGSKLYRFSLTRLINALDGDIQESYNSFCKRNAGTNQLKTMKILFPVLFNVRTLFNAGYVKNPASIEQVDEIIQNFVWMGSDVLAKRNMSEFYALSKTLPTNACGTPQPVVTVNDRKGLISFASVDREKKVWADEGVVFWNLKTCRRIFDKEKLKMIIDVSQDARELNINFLLDYWIKQSFSKAILPSASTPCLADKIFNVTPKDWLDAVWHYNFLKFLTETADDASMYRKNIRATWLDAYKSFGLTMSDGSVLPICDSFFEGIIQQKNKKLTTKKTIDSIFTGGARYLESRLQNLTELVEYQDTPTDKAEVTFDGGTFFGSSDVLLKRLAFVATEPVVLNWDGCYKPWNSIAIQLKKRMIEPAAGAIRQILSNFINLDAFNLADILWIKNLLSWLNADEITDNKNEHQDARCAMISNWFNSLMRNVE